MRSLPKTLIRDFLGAGFAGRAAALTDAVRDQSPLLLFTGRSIVLLLLACGKETGSVAILGLLTRIEIETRKRCGC